MSTEESQVRRMPSTGWASQMTDVPANDIHGQGILFESMDQVMRMGDVMASAGAMLPEHLRGESPLCTAIILQAIVWGFKNPFALAGETFLAKASGVIGYQAKVYTAVIRMAGIDLVYEYEGKFELQDKPVKSQKGNVIAPRTATGNLRVIVYPSDKPHQIYTSPTLDEIGNKNSPLWHNDPQQQLAYYGGRAWCRRYRSDLIMGTKSDDEVQAMAEPRDITPRKRKENGFMKLARENHVDAQAEPRSVDTSAKTEEATTEAVAASDDDTETALATPQEPEIDTSSDAYEAGRTAAEEGFIEINQCPLKDPTEVTAWRAGFESLEAEQ